MPSVLRVLLRVPRSRSVLVACLAFALAMGFTVLSAPSASADTKRSHRMHADPDQPQPWPERLWRRIRTLGDELVVSLSTALFDGLDQLDVNFLRLPGNTRLGFRTERAVLDNFDLMNTYTVIDRTRFRVRSNPLYRVTTWKEDRETPVYGVPFASAVFDAQTSIEWMNIRQVGARKHHEEVAARTSREKRDFHFSLRDPGFDLTQSPMLLREEDVKDLNPDVSLSYFDPEIRAQFAKLPNLLTFPFRIPLHRRDVSRMQDGEILSYAFDAQIEVGLGVGLKVIPDLGIVHAGIDARGALLTRGRFQIMVLRENARFARVKLTRLGETGAKAGLRVGLKRKKVLSDFLVFKGKSLVSSVSLNFIPFDLETARIKGSQFDVVYRYDLESEEGRKAYHKAVLGFFAHSAEVEEDFEGREGVKPVERLISRDLERKTRSTSLKTDISHLLRLSWNSRKEVLEAVLDEGNGRRTVFEGKKERNKSHRFLFGAVSERATRRLTLSVDEERFMQGGDDSVFVIAEVFENDSRTSEKELNAVIDRMEKLLRRRDILPNAVRFGNRKIWYGRSSFHYGYSLSLRELRTFFATDRIRVSSAASASFSKSAADEFMRAWDACVVAIRNGSNSKMFFEALAELFTDRFQLERLTAVVFDSLAGEEVEYFVSAQNAAFGRVQVRGKTVTSVELALTRTDQQLGWESYSRLNKIDPEAVVSSIAVREDRDGMSRLSFDLSHHPAHVYFRIYRISGVKRQTTLAEVIASNQRGKFRRGTNSLLLDPFSGDPLVSKLSRHLKEDQRYLVTIAFSRAKDRFGSLSSAHFRVGAAFDPERIQPTTETSENRANSGPK